MAKSPFKKKPELPYPVQNYIDHLKQFRPKQYQRLQSQGKLESHASAVVDSHYRQLENMVKQGWPEHLAEEELRENLHPPSEEDQPVLGESPKPKKSLPQEDLDANPTLALADDLIW